MKLSLDNLEKIEKIVDKNPSYDVKKLRKDSIEDPKWLAFGSGNIFRGYIARIGQDMINSGEFDRGISVVETFDPEIIDRIYKPFDNLALSVTLNKDGDFKTELIGNLAESLTLKDMDRIKEIALSANLQIMSFTITEKGYNLYNSNGELLDIVKDDINGDPKNSKHLMSILTYLLYERYKDSKSPLTLLSMDNASHNGDLVKNSVLLIANSWAEDEKIEKEFIDYLNNDLSYPLSMIDKITPRPAKVIEEYLTDLGFSDMETVITDKNTYIAPFVNSEEAEYLVIEDNFKNSRPPFEKGGVYITDRDTVNKVETMKVTTCLNPLHTALAVYGSMLGFNLISDEMNDPLLLNLIKEIGYNEGLPVVVDPKIINPKEFIDEVINVRFPNPYMPDTPQRIATDTSQKMAVRFGETIKRYVEDENLDPKDLKYIPLAIAGWLRYLLGVDDLGNPFELSPDPMMDELQEIFSKYKISEIEDTKDIEDLLKKESIFGVDLVKVGLSDKIIDYFKELSNGKNAVRNTLKKYLG